MAYIKLKTEHSEVLRTLNPRLISYNVEMTEVTGGTFWKAYTDAQIDGTEEVPPPDFSKGMAAMHQWYDPIDTTNPRLIKLAKALDNAANSRNVVVLRDYKGDKRFKRVLIEYMQTA